MPRKRRSRLLWTIQVLFYHAFLCIQGVKVSKESPVLVSSVMVSPETTTLELSPLVASSSTSTPLSKPAVWSWDATFRDDMGLFHILQRDRQRRPSDTSLLAEALERKTAFIDSIKSIPAHRKSFSSRPKRSTKALDDRLQNSFPDDPFKSITKRPKIFKVQGLPPSPPKSILIKSFEHRLLVAPELVNAKDMEDHDSILNEDTDKSQSPDPFNMALDYDQLRVSQYGKIMPSLPFVGLPPVTELFEPSKNQKDEMSFTRESRHSPSSQSSESRLPDAVGSTDSDSSLESDKDEKSQPKAPDSASTEQPALNALEILSDDSVPSFKSDGPNDVLSDEETFEQAKSTSSASDVSIEEDPTGQWLELDQSFVLGRGSFGFVYRAVTRDAFKVPFAVKILNINLINHQRAFPIDLETFQNLASREASICRSLNYPTIMKCRGPFFSQSGQQAHIVMDYCESDVKTQMTIHQMDSNRAGCMLWQLVHTLHYLHQTQHVAHLDIKPSNILYHKYSAPLIKLGDFGSSHYAGPLGNVSREHVGGTHPYMAPELFKTALPSRLRRQVNDPMQSPLGDTLAPYEFDGFAADVFSAGMTYFFARFKYKPWKVSSIKDPDFMAFVENPATLFSAKPGPQIRIFELLGRVTAPEKTLILGLMDVNWKSRFTTFKILQDPFFQSLETFCPSDLIQAIKETSDLSMDTQFSPSLPSKAPPSLD